MIKAAKAKLGGRGRGTREHMGVVATLLVQVEVEADLHEDGSFSMKNVTGPEEARVVKVPATMVEAAIEEAFDPEELADAYMEATALDLEPGATADDEDEDEED